MAKIEYGIIRAGSIAFKHTSPHDIGVTECDKLHVSQSGSRHAISVDDSAIDLDAKAGPARHGDLAVDLTDRFECQMIAERVFLLLELEHWGHREKARRLIWNRREEVDRRGKAMWSRLLCSGPSPRREVGCIRRAARASWKSRLTMASSVGVSVMARRPWRRHS